MKSTEFSIYFCMYDYLVDYATQLFFFRGTCAVPQVLRGVVVTGIRWPRGSVTAAPGTQVI